MQPPVMTAVPTPKPSSESLDQTFQGLQPPAASIPTLKKLVARLQREQRKVQDLLSSLSFSLRSFNNLNQFLALIPLIVSRVTDADAAALVLFRPNGQVLIDQLFFHESNPSRQIRNALEMATQALSAGQISPSKYAALLEQQLSRLLDDDYRWFSTAILVRHVEPHERGRLYLFSRNPGYEWTETRQKLAQLVADQTAVAIENDDLNAQVRKQERLARELEIGAEIQARLLPNQCPDIEGVELAATCKTASQVGGDYYDFIPISLAHPTAQPYQSSNADRWSLVIGDVMGKGVPAGLIMTMTRGMLRTDILNRHSPARILQDLNSVMYGDLETSNRFVTLFYSEYDPKTQTLFYSNAAHHPPLLWRSQTDRIEHLDTDGMLIGLDINTEFCESQVQLFPGDTIIYYTDGFTDAANPTSGERFDEENLVKAFHEACHRCQTPQQILDYLFGQVQSFIGRQGIQNDDMTLIVLRVKPKPITLPV
ncbi:MAG: PP2C family protein-serine/threonine phosphatase [Thermosynechococcaceae cyanobacterium]